MSRLTRYMPLLVVGVCLFLCAGAFAQSTTDGAIGGTVYDAQKAAVPNAKVTVHNNGTNIDKSVTTGATGDYRVVNLQPGSYTVTIEAAGFSKSVDKNVTVEIGRISTIDGHLQVGGSSESVDVTSEAPQVNTEQGDFASNVNQTAIANLPINGRRWSNFALLTPGVNNDANGFGLLSFRGISALLNNNTVDGADNNQAYFSEERGRTRASYSTSQAAIQEFQVNGSNYSAEFGRAAGGVVNTVTKSGTNNLHGEAFFYDRDNDWGATNPFTTLTTNQNGTFVTGPYKPKDWRKQWGFGAGGALIKDKLFWFYSYDQQKRNFPGTGRAGNPQAFFASPAAALPAGKTCATVKSTDFSDPNVGAASVNAAILCTKFAIPYASAVTKYGEGLGVLNGFLGTVPRNGDQVINFPKLDWQMNANNRMSIQYNRLRWDSPAGIQTQRSNTLGIASFGNDFVKEDWGIMRLTSLINTTITNELRFQYGRDFEFENSQTPTPGEVPLAQNRFGRPSQIAIAGSNGFNIGTPNFLERAALPDERRIQVADTITKVYGKHVMKFGTDVNHVYDYISNLFNEHGSYSYTNSGNFLADYFHLTQGLGTFTTSNYSSYSQALGPRAFDFTTNDFAFFGTDDYKIFPRLTITLGARYEYQRLPSPFVPNPNLNATNNKPSDINNFGPRFGFAYDVFGSGKTVVRGGYGIFYGRIVNGTIFSAFTTSGNSTAGVSSFSFSSPTAAGAPVFPNILSSVAGTLAKPNVIFLDKHLQNPQIQQFDLIVEHDLGWNTVVSASYLGSLGRELPNFLDTNFNTSSVSSITYNVVGGGPIPGSTYTTRLFTGARPNSSFNAITDVLSNVNSSYNALVLEAKHRMRHGLQFNANYTWAHALDFNQNQTTGTFTNSTLDPLNFAADYGNSNLDIRHRLVVSTVYQPEHKFAGWVGYLLNDYTMSPIVQIQTGLPFTAGVSGSAPGGAISGINGSGGDNRIDIVGRNTFRRPNDYIVDYRMSKAFTFRDRYRLEFLGEAFNLFNHQNVTANNTTAYTISTVAGVPTLTFNPQFGSITNANSNTVYNERQVQLGIRLQF